MLFGHFWVAGGAVHNLKLWTPFTILWTPFTIFVNAVHKILRIFFKNKNSKKFLQVKNLAVSITFGPSKRWAPHPAVFYCKNCTRNKSKAERGTREVFGLFRVLRLRMTLISKICCQEVGLTLLQGVFIKNKASKKILIFLFFLKIRAEPFTIFAGLWTAFTKLWTAFTIVNGSALHPK